MKELSEKYTSKSSTSIPYEAAQQLMEDILYCIAEAEKCSEFQENYSAVADNQNTVMLARDLYEKGYQLVIQKVVMAQKLYNDMIVDFCSFGNLAYEDTVTKAIPAFFQWYDARFCPQNSIIGFDYPVLIPLEKQCGIDAIYDYIQCIQCEQQFLRKMQRGYVR